MNEVNVSVIVPVYGNPEFLIKALASLVEQTADNYEIIVVDDHSPQPLEAPIHQHFAKELKSKQLRVVRNEVNKGAAGSRNIGATLARGKYFLFADSDELFERQHITALLHTLQKTKATVVAQHTKVFIDETDKVLHRRTFSYRGSNEFKLFLLGLTGSDILVDRNAFHEVNGFAENMTYAEDWDFLVRLYQQGYPFAFNDSGTKLHREHSDSITGTFNWTSHRVERMIPAIQHNPSFSKHQKAVFIFGTILNAPVSLVPSLLKSLLKTSPTFFLREWGAYFYMHLSMKKRLDRQLAKLTNSTLGMMVTTASLDFLGAI